MAILREKFENDWDALPTLLQSWFVNESSRADPKPCLEACVTLTYEFMAIFNRHNNFGWESRSEHVPLGKFKDLSPAEWEAKKVMKFMAAANEFLVAAEELENSLGGYAWEDRGETIRLADVQTLLGRIGAMPVAPFKFVKAKNRPSEPWHLVAKQIAPLIENALRKAGQHKKLTPTNESSVTAHVAARLITWAFTKTVTAAAFAKAMQNRNRSKKGKNLTFEKRFPDVSRINIL